MSVIKVVYIFKYVAFFMADCRNIRYSLHCDFPTHDSFKIISKIRNFFTTDCEWFRSYLIKFTCFLKQIIELCSFLADSFQIMSFFYAIDLGKM